MKPAPLGRDPAITSGLMLPRRLYLTCHGLGTPPFQLSSESRRFWLTTDVFAQTLGVAAELERATGVDIRFTFDDGNESDLKIALPMLLAHHRPATFFVCAGRIGKPGYLTSKQLREIVAEGMTIGCHGFDHLNWREANDRQLQHELYDAKLAIEDILGSPIDVASAPFGGLNQRVVRSAAAAGYRCLFASSGGFATAATGLIPRNTLKDGFEPKVDLVRMATRGNRAWAGIYDTARRVKYGFY